MPSVEATCRDLEATIALSDKDLTAKVFSKTFDEALAALALPVNDLAERFRETRPAILHWRMGNVAPPVPRRREVLAHLLERARTQA